MANTYHQAHNFNDDGFLVKQVIFLHFFVVFKKIIVYIDVD